jgi:hypothetical protein
MRHTKDHKTGYLFDPWDHLGPKRRRLLERSWAGVFREYLLNELPVEKIASSFHPSLGRPSKELYTALGTLLLQQLHDLSDGEVVCTLAFDTRWHYALDITATTDEQTTIAERTLREYRRMVIEQKLDGYLFETLTDKLIAAFDVDTSKQRLDSSHIRSNMRRLSRIGLFAATIRKFLLNLKRRHRQLFDAHIPPELVARYLKKANGCFSHIKPSEARKTLRLVGEDLFFLVQRFQAHKKVCRLNSFHLLRRLLHEQCTVSGSGDHDHKVEVKPPKQVASDSLQNPSDPDATYDGHNKVQGYQVQVMESFVADEQHDRTKPNLITDVQVQGAHHSDSEALIPAIERTQKRGCVAQEIQADASYGSDENVQAAAGRGVEVVSPLIGKKTHKLGLDRFRFHSRKGTITACPLGPRPQKSYRTKKARFVARFSLEHCQGCPQKAQCPVQFGTAGAYLRYTAKQVRLANRRAYEKTPLFRDRYRWRAGVEATNSHLKSDTGAGQLRVRGLPAVRYCVTLKALGLNILRATSARMTQMRANTALAKGILAKIRAFFRLRGYFRAFLDPVSSQLPNLFCQRASTFN